MNKLEVPQPARHRLRVTELHPHLMCVLCGGYYVDATTIIECLHSFCKSCLVRYLESNKYCPICEVQVHKTKPLLNIRPDETLQNMVYKLVPGLFQREMRVRQEFYAQHPDAPPSSPEDRGIVDPIECQFYTPEEPVSLALEFRSDNNATNSNGVHKRYLRCPAAVTVAHLQKLVRNKYGLSPCFAVDVMFDDKLLMPDLSIMDIAYSFQRKRKEQFHFTYRIVEVQHKRMRFDDPPPNIDPVEPMEVDTPETPAVPSQNIKSSDAHPQPECKSKLDSIISRLGIAKQSESVVKKDKSDDEWKEVQLQISENGVMKVTDISSIDKLINTIEKNVGSSEKPSVGAAEKTDSTNVKQATGAERKPDKEPLNSPEASKAPTSITASKGEQRKIVGSPLKTNQLKDKIQIPKTETKVEDKPTVTVSAEVIKKEAEKAVQRAVANDTKAMPPPSSSMPSPRLTPVSSADQNIPLQRVQVSVSSQPNLAPGNAATVTTSKLCTVSSGASHVSQSVSSSVSSCPSVCTTAPFVVLSSACSSKTSNSTVTMTTAVRAAPVPVAKPLPTAPSTKKSSSPVGYKTLKCGPKNWNPTISRNSFLSSKMEQQPQQQGSGASSAGASAASSKTATPPKFFKMRNTPRYLGNPASGVKAMYQVPDTKPETPPPAKSPSLMKLDPRTLTPIVSNSSSPTPKSPSGQPKGRPPFPSTTLSAQVSNHMPSSRSVATTTSTTSSSTKLNDLSSLRNSSNQPLVNPLLSNHFVPKVMPNFLYGGVPGLLPPAAQFASMFRPGLGYPPVTATGFHPTLPQTAGMLFNPHQLHRQLNSSSPGSPSPYPSSLASSSSMSLPQSPSLSPNQRLPVSSEKPSSSPSAQSSPNRSNRTATSSLMMDPGKVNGSETTKSSLTNKLKPTPVNVEPTSALDKIKETSTSSTKDTKTSSANVNNNNTLLLSNSKLSTEKVGGEKLPQEVSKPPLKVTGEGKDEQLTSRSKTPVSSSFQTQRP